MKILIIGGTRFLGRHLVNSARARRHEVTLFNRGKTNPNLFGQVDKIQGDREKDLDQLSGQWDAVIDTCGYFSRIVRMSAEALKGKVEQYVFISSISAYADFKKIGINESDPVGKIEDETMEEITGESYGPLKALCEKAVQEVFGMDSWIMLPVLIVGLHDPTRGRVAIGSLPIPVGIRGERVLDIHRLEEAERRGGGLRRGRRGRPEDPDEKVPARVFAHGVAEMECSGQVPSGPSTGRGEISTGTRPGSRLLMARSISVCTPTARGSSLFEMR